MNLKDGYELLLSDPRTLLDNAYVSLAGGTESTLSDRHWFTISMPKSMQNAFTRAGRNGTIPTYQVDLHETRPAKMRYSAGGEEYYAFEAWYVAMKRQVVDGSVPAGTLCRLSATNGPDICITSQLSGCTFGIGNQVPGGCCTVTHIQPLGQLAAAQPKMATQTNALHGGAAALLVASGTDYADRANVLGKRMSAYWFFYLQEYTGGFVRQIRGVRDLN